MNPKTKVLLVDDHQIVLDSLRLLFSSIDNVVISGTIANTTQILGFLEENPIDIIIMDIHMPKFTGIDIALKIKNQFPFVKILLLTMAEDAPTIREAIKVGVNGYVLKKAGKEEIEKAIKAIMSGRKYFSEDVILELAASPEEDLNENNPKTILHLTGREIEVLRLISQELSTNEIAEKLFISVPTVETHRRNLMQKLGVRSAIGMVKFAIRHGLSE